MMPTTSAGRRLAALLLATAASAIALPATALDTPHRGTVEAGLDRTAYDGGARAELAVALTLEDGWHVNSHQPTYDYLIPTELTVTLPEGWEAPAVTYPDSVRRTFAFAEEPLDVYEGRVVMRGTLSLPAGVAAGRYPLGVAVRYQACDHESCLPPVVDRAALELVVGPGGELANATLFDAAAAGAAPPAAPGASRLAAILLLGLVGGLILNVMPCVLPVLSLKVFGLVKAAGLGRRQVVAGALATAAGIVASFWALAAFAVVARSAGAAVGWGVQFQEPGFVTFLAVVVVLFCLNLWGLFEIPLPARLAGALGGGGRREGLAGHFASGLFATLMATPCSAPFLGTAMGFALAQSSAVILATFTAVGIGMALPYLALAVAPGAARLLPRPGEWMEHVRKVMGFLLAAAAVWLFYVLAAQITAERLAAIELGLLAVALLVWVRSRVATRGAWRHAAAAGVLAAAVVTLGIAVGAEAGPATRPAAAAGSSERLIAWEPFDRQRAERLAAAGRLVFVDVTADWCFTCKANERLVLETPETAALFRDHDVVAMRADWTNRDAEIADFLAAHGRYSIPFYLLYRPGAEPLPFSELLTRAALRDALAGDVASGTPASPSRFWTSELRPLDGAATRG